jgi:DNA replication and repair protein RecF
MRVQSLYLKNYRNHRDACFDFDSGINILCGPNASGKTNVLESLYLFISGRSIRNAPLLESICTDGEAFFLQMQFSKQGIEQSFKIAYNKNEKKILYNQTPLNAFSGLIGILQGTALTPDDAALIKGAPSLRRQFLDLLIAQNDPLYIHYSTRFYRAMQQRNCTLRKRDAKGAICWEEEMANAAVYIWKQRASAVQKLQQECQRLHHALTDPTSRLTFGFKSFASLSEDNLKERLLESYEKHRKREMELGFTLVGPHKDDLIIKLNAQEARFFASEGQQRTIATVLRLGEWELLKAASEEMPIMILDDLGMGLDPARKQRLLEHLTRMGQVFISTTSDLPIPSRIFSLG